MRVSNKPTIEERTNAIQRIVGLCGAPVIEDSVCLAMADELRDLTRDELSRAVKLCARDEELVRAIRFGSTLALSDIYRVLKGGKKPTRSIPADEAPGWAKESIEAGELVLKQLGSGPEGKRA